ncbi:MAG: dual specificity protein phosphatase family protein [Caldilineales bacterium]|nr:dual specificity protein phosphatase family protein [Caldilineales bacterium]
MSSPISQITPYLYIAANPRRDVADQLQEAGVHLVISMIAIRPSLRFFRHPFRILILPTFDDPRLPIPIFVLQRGVKAALPVIERGEAALVYCREGRHRSVAMACCILIAKGMTADEAMTLVTEKREIADPHAPHIESQIRLFERSWKES